jgi:hypothetical protein
VILHKERANKLFGKGSMRLLNCFSTFIITIRRPFLGASVDCRYLQHTVVRTEQHLRNSTVIKELKSYHCSAGEQAFGFVWRDS